MMNGYWFGFSGLLMGLFWIFVVAAVVWLVLTFLRTQTRLGGEEPRSALRILDERLARGEIDVEEYRTRRVALDDARR